MPDLEISRLPQLAGADVQGSDPIAVADLSASETKRLSVSDLLTNGVQFIGDNAISSDQIISLNGSKIEANTITAAQLAPDSVTDSELADQAVDTAALKDLAVTNSKVAPGLDGAKLQALSVTDAQILSLDGAKIDADTIGSNAIGPGAVGNSELGDDAVSTLKIQDGAVTSSKIAGDIDGSKIVDGSITAGKYAPGSVGETILADGSITDAKVAGDISGAKLLDGSIGSGKLGANSVTTSAIADGAVTDAKIAGNISGTRLVDGSIASSKYGAGSVGETAIADGAVTDVKITGPVDGAKLDAGTVAASKLGTVTDRGLDQSTGNVGIANTVTPGTQAGITWNAQGLITSTNPVNPSDLPIATDISAGAVSVPTSGGLAVTGLGALSIANDVTPDTVRGIEYNEHGCIVSIAPTVDPSSVPIATQTDIGGVKVPGPEIGVAADGSLTFADSGVTPGVYAKVTVNAKGVVTVGSGLAAADIPFIDASKISTGEFPTARIGDKSITLPKLADYSISFIQEAVPAITPSLHIGCLWFQESTAGLYMWNGNSWLPISIGRLSQENLRYCGTIDATTGLITGVTSFGTSAGYTVGDPLATASDTLTGTYFVVSVAGNGIPQLPGVNFDNGDWVLCNGSAAGYVRIDTLSGGGGGGGGASVLNDLLDVTITAPMTAELLSYSAGGQWTNVNEIDGGSY